MIRELHSIETGESNESEQWELVKVRMGPTVIFSDLKCQDVGF